MPRVLGAPTDDAGQRTFLPYYAYHLREEWEGLTRNARILLKLALVQTAVVLAATVINIILNRLNDAVPEDFLKDLAYGLLIVVSILFFIYFAFDAVMTENKFVMMAFGACAVIIVARVAYTLLVLLSQQYYATDVPFSPFPPYFDPLVYLNGALLVVLLVLDLVTSVFYAVVWRDFGWKMYKTVGANKELVAYFREYQAFLTLLKVDVQFAVSLVLMVGFFLVQNDYGAVDGVTLAASMFLLVLAFGHAFIGWLGIVRESVALVVLFFLASVIEPAFVVFKISQFYAKASQFYDCSYVPCVLFTATGVVAMATRLLVLLFALRNVMHFGHGMKKVFGFEENSKMLPLGASGPGSDLGTPLVAASTPVSAVQRPALPAVSASPRSAATYPMTVASRPPALSRISQLSRTTGSSAVSATSTGTNIF